MDDEDIRDLHDPGLDGLHIVACAGHQHNDRDVGLQDNLHLVLPDTDRLDDDHVATGRVEHEHGIARRPRQPSQVAASGHAPDEDPLVGGVGLHPEAIPRTAPR